MHSAIAHHPLTDAQPVPEEQLPPPSQLPLVYMLSMMSYGMEYPFGQLGSAVLPVPPSDFLCTSNLLTGGRCEEQRRPWLCVSTAQE